MYPCLETRYAQHNITVFHATRRVQSNTQFNVNHAIKLIMYLPTMPSMRFP